MDFSKLKFPAMTVVAALSVALGAGGSLALANAKQAHTLELVARVEERTVALEKESQQNRERVLRIEILSQQTNKVVERIERKLDQR